MNFKSILIGGTGATGRKVLKQLIVYERCSQITSIGRRKLDSDQMHDKINHIVTDTLLDLSNVGDSRYPSFSKYSLHSCVFFISIARYSFFSKSLNLL